MELGPSFLAEPPPVFMTARVVDAPKNRTAFFFFFDDLRFRVQSDATH